MIHQDKKVNVLLFGFDFRTYLVVSCLKIFVNCATLERIFFLVMQLVNDHCFIVMVTTLDMLGLRFIL